MECLRIFEQSASGHHYLDRLLLLCIWFSLCYDESLCFRNKASFLKSFFLSLDGASCVVFHEIFFSEFVPSVVNFLRNSPSVTGDISLNSLEEPSVPCEELVL